MFLGLKCVRTGVPCGVYRNMEDLYKVLFKKFAGEGELKITTDLVPEHDRPSHFIAKTFFEIDGARFYEIVEIDINTPVEPYLYDEFNRMKRWRRDV